MVTMMCFTEKDQGAGCTANRECKISGAECTNNLCRCPVDEYTDEGSNICRPSKFNSCPLSVVIVNIKFCLVC